MPGRSSLKTIRGNLAWLALRLLKRKYVVRRIHGYEMELHMQDQGLSKQLYVHGKREAEHAFILRKVLKPRSRILEIGANIGYYCLLEKRLAPDCCILAVEPHPLNHEILLRNLRRNGIEDILTRQMAVSEKKGVETMHTSRMGNCHSLHPEKDAKVPYTGTLQVPTTTVEELTHNHPVDLMRMDIEGHEVSVLRSLRKTLLPRNCHPSILFEVHRKKYGPNNSLEKELIKFHEHGYLARHVATSGPEGTQRLKSRGFSLQAEVATDHTERGIFENIPLVYLATTLSKDGGIRAIYLEYSR